MNTTFVNKIVAGDYSLLDDEIENLPKYCRQQSIDSALEKCVMQDSDVETIRQLLENGADPNGTRQRGRPLTYAYVSGNEPTVELLLAARANPNEKHCTALENAVEQSDVKYVCRFLSAGAKADGDNINADLLSLTDDKQILKMLVDRDVPGVTDELRRTVHHTRKPLMSDFEYPAVKLHIKNGVARKKTSELKPGVKLTEIDDKEFLISGNVKNYVQKLKNVGGKYDFDLHGWKFPSSSRNAVDIALGLAKDPDDDFDTPSAAFEKLDDFEDDDPLQQQLDFSAQMPEADDYQIPSRDSQDLQNLQRTPQTPGSDSEDSDDIDPDDLNDQESIVSDDIELNSNSSEKADSEIIDELEEELRDIAATPEEIIGDLNREIATMDPISDEDSTEESDDVESHVQLLDSESESDSSDTEFPRPTIEPESDEELVLTTIYGPYGMLTLDSIVNVKLNDKTFDSISRYLMWREYKNSKKGDAILEAESTDAARAVYLLNELPDAKTPKEHIRLKRLTPIVKSKRDTEFNSKVVLTDALRELHNQNPILKQVLLATGDRYIFNQNALDIYGYPGNSLGNALMRLRAEYTNSEPPEFVPTNSLRLDKYSPNFLIVRGDPTADVAEELQRLASYRTKAGKIVRGGLRPAKGGAGYLIPIQKRGEIKAVLFEKYPSEMKFYVCSKSWVKKRAKAIVEIGGIFSRFRERDEIGSESVFFAIRDFFLMGKYLPEEDTTEPDRLIIDESVKKARSMNLEITEHAIEIVAGCVENTFDVLFGECYSSEDPYACYKNTVAMIQEKLLHGENTSIPGLSPEESYFVRGFNRIYRLLDELDNNRTRVCVTVIHMMFGDSKNMRITELYREKIQNREKQHYESDAERLRAFGIRRVNVEDLLENLPEDLPFKCLLLVMTAIDFYLHDEEPLELTKRFLMIC